ncbi:MAG TPA: 5-(carboxyamino)imidazole ribonucleotide mutase [Melioribacteraceae bacterium]|nr:5-(carboxyamino)imidazole ribonucleotide mutase [Melioribacteraceae bacterium]
MQEPLVGIIMGSDSDLSSMQGAIDICKQFSVSFEVKIISAHRTPNYMAEYALKAKERGLKVIIAGAGGAAHLPGMTASYTELPVIGVPVQSRALNGLDSLLSIVQMPAGVPVATVGINQSKNAGLLAVKILAIYDSNLMLKLQDYMKLLSKESMNKNEKLVY